MTVSAVPGAGLRVAVHHGFFWYPEIGAVVDADPVHLRLFQISGAAPQPVAQVIPGLLAHIPGRALIGVLPVQLKRLKQHPAIGPGLPHIFQIVAGGVNKDVVVQAGALFRVVGEVLVLRVVQVAQLLTAGFAFCPEGPDKGLHTLGDLLPARGQVSIVICQHRPDIPLAEVGGQQQFQLLIGVFLVHPGQGRGAELLLFRPHLPRVSGVGRRVDGLQHQRTYKLTLTML